MSSAALVDLGRLPLQMVGINILLDALGLIMMQALLGVGASRLVMIVAVGLQWLVFLLAAYLLGPVLAMGLTAIWIAMALYRLLQPAIFTAAWRRGAGGRSRFSPSRQQPIALAAKTSDD